MGLLLNCPTFGCTKNKLIGDYKEPGEEKGTMKPLIDETGDIFVKPNDILDINVYKNDEMDCIICKINTKDNIVKRSPVKIVFCIDILCYLILSYNIIIVHSYINIAQFLYLQSSYIL